MNRNITSSEKRDVLIKGITLLKSIRKPHQFVPFHDSLTHNSQKKFGNPVDPWLHYQLGNVFTVQQGNNIEISFIHLL